MTNASFAAWEDDAMKTMLMIALLIAALVAPAFAARGGRDGIQAPRSDVPQAPTDVISIQAP